MPGGKPHGRRRGARGWLVGHEPHGHLVELLDVVTRAITDLDVRLLLANRDDPDDIDRQLEKATIRASIERLRGNLDQFVNRVLVD